MGHIESSTKFFEYLIVVVQFLSRERGISTVRPRQSKAVLLYIGCATLDGK